MAVDLQCEADGCARRGGHLVTGDRGTWWLCTRCADEWTSLPAARTGDTLLGLGAWLGYFVGVVLVLHGLALIVSQVELQAGLAWLRWAEAAAGAAVMAWSWGALRTTNGRPTT